MASIEKEKKASRTKLLQKVRLTLHEKLMLDKEFSKSFFAKKADFIRYKLFDKTYSEYRQKQYEAEIAAGALIDELSKLGNNVNQIAKRMNTYKDDSLNKNEVLLIGATAKLLLRIQKTLANDSENK